MLRLTATLVSLSALLLAPAAQAQLGLGPVPLNTRTAGQFGVLAKTAITNVPTSAITGNVGISPNGITSVTGFNLTPEVGYATSTQVVGRVYGAGQAAPSTEILTTAILDMEMAYDDAAGRPTPNFTELNSGNIGGLTLVPGLYKWSGGVTAPTNFTLAGGPNDVWIFQIAGTLGLSTGVRMTLAGGSARNVFWQTAGAVTLGTGSHLQGVVLSKTAINMLTGATLLGRALAQTAVTLDMNTITRPASAPNVSSTLVISQFQVAGGGAVAPADEFIEIHNISAGPIDLNGYRIVYRSAAGVSDVAVTNFTTSTIVPSGGYYLVAHATGYDGPTTADRTYNTGVNGALSGVSGGLGLRNGALDTGTLIDAVGYGAATNAFVETIVTAAPAANGSQVRLNFGTLDTDNNSNDFGALITSTPRFSGSPPYLPVELVSFTGAADGSSAQLTWTTASETNNAGFSVETLRGAEWAEVAFVSGRGTTSEAHTYRRTVSGLAPGRHAFRLRQVDLDGTATLSGTVEVEIAGTGLRIYPSPARTSVQIEGLTAAADVVDVLGRVVGRAMPGEALSVSALAPGVYVVMATEPVRFIVAR